MIKKVDVTTTKIYEIVDFLRLLIAGPAVGLSVIKRTEGDLVKVDLILTGVSKNNELVECPIRDFADHPEAFVNEEEEIDIIIEKARAYAAELFQELKDNHKIRVYANRWELVGDNFRPKTTVDFPESDKTYKPNGFLYNFYVPSNRIPVTFFRASLKKSKEINKDVIRLLRQEVKPCCGTCLTLKKMKDPDNRPVNFCALQFKRVPLAGVCLLWNQLTFSPCIVLDPS